MRRKYSVILVRKDLLFAIELKLAKLFFNNQETRFGLAPHLPDMLKRRCACPPGSEMEK